jgi:hypothetical protein
MHTKEGWSVELKIIATHNLGDSIRPITKWVKLLMEIDETLLLQMQPDFVANLKWVWYLVLIMELLVLSIGFMKNILDLLADVLNPVNESGGFVDRRLIGGRVCMCGGKRNCNINGSQGLKSQTHLKWDVAGENMDRLVVTVLDIWEILIQCTWMLRIVHVQDVHNHSIDDLCFSIYLGVESNGFCELGVQQRPESLPKRAEEPTILVEDDGLWYPKMDPHSFEEDLSSIFHCDILLTGCEDGHLQKLINDHRHTFIPLLGG